MSAELDYWRECVSIAAEECDLEMTAEQLNALAESVQAGHEYYGMSFYQPESPYPSEIERLEKELKKERDKRGCPECRGSGRITERCGPWISNSECHVCRGAGKVAG